MTRNKLFLVFLFFINCIFISSCSIESRLDKAYDYYREGEYEKAASIYRSVLKRKPDEKIALKGLADISIIQKDFSNAIMNYKKAVEADPSFAAKELVSMLTYNDSAVRDEAAQVIATLTNGSYEVVTQIISQIEAGNQYVKVDYLDALKKIGRPASFAIPEIAKYLDHEYNMVRKYALEALGAMDPVKVREAEVLPKMISLINDKDAIVAEAAFKSLGALKGEASIAIPNLIKELDSKKPDRNALIKSTLENIGPGRDEAIDGIIKLTNDKNPTIVRVAAIDSLTEIGLRAKKAVPDLIPLSIDSNNEIRVAAVCALGKIGRPDTESVPELIKLLQHPSSHVKLRAIVELSEMGKAASPAIRSLNSLRSDSNREVADAAKKASNKISQATR